MPPEVIARGDLLEVIHAKINDGPKAETFLLRRQGHAFHRFEPQDTSRRTQHARIMRRLFEWYGRREQAPFSKDRISKSKETLGEVFGMQRVSRAQVREAYDEALAAGDLVPSEQRAENNRDFLVSFRPGYEPPAAPVEDEGPL